MKTFTRDEMRELDRTTIQDVGIPGVILMENAGKGAALFLRRLWLARAGNDKPFADFRDDRDDLAGVRVLILAGPGNNGGDGFVMARHLHNWGARVKVLLLASGDRFKPGTDAGINYQAARAMHLDLDERLDEAAVAAFDAGSYDVVVDGIFGTGLQRGIRGPARAAIEAVNALEGAFRFAIDIPSGLDADTGEVHGVCFRAHATATFGGMKKGMENPSAGAFTGDVRVIDISVPRELYG